MDAADRSQNRSFPEKYSEKTLFPLALFFVFPYNMG